jgi:hypothetical protein
LGAIIATSMFCSGLICAKWIENPCANISIDRGCRFFSIDSRKSLPWPASGVSTITTVASDTASGTGTARRPSASTRSIDLLPGYRPTRTSSPLSRKLSA